MKNYNLASPFVECAITNPDRPALIVGGKTIKYGDLRTQASRMAGELVTHLESGRIGILATRSLDAYVGILGACMAGGTYVALNQKWPADRLIKLFQSLQLDALVVDRNGAGLLTPEVLAAAPKMIITLDESSVSPDLRDRIKVLSERGASPLPQPVIVGPDHHGYIIFTSGTTGLPKGVVISAGSLATYLAGSRPWTQLTPQDRVAEAHDITFDLSVHNLFLTLESGACLAVMSALELMAPAHFVRRHGITAWMSVPTIANMMRKTGALQPGVFPTLRLSIFCGEPLPVATAQAWAAATPDGVVENIYGPTECTVVMLRQQLTAPPRETSGRGVLAIGTPFASGRVAILDSQQQPLPDGMAGEIALAGPQVGVGYFGSPEQTADRFRIINGERWYLTGDLGMRDPDGVFHHLGRVDNQVKVKGNRIELEEVEAHLRVAAGTEVVAVVAWPVIDGSAQGLVGFVAGATRGADEIRNALLVTLPRYMIPERIEVRDVLHVNANGKIDRRALRDELEEDSRERRIA